MDKKLVSNLKETFFELLEIISDKSFQERIWVKGEGPEVSCSDEVLDFFLEYTEYALGNSEDWRFTKEQLELLSELKAKVVEYNKRCPETDAEIVVDPKWDEIRKFAKVVYDKLKEEIK